MKSIPPQVVGNICTDSTRPLYPPMEVGSEIWFSWLREFNVGSFHYESETGKFTGRREERSSSTNDYWYAYRKVHGKLRKVYLGDTGDLTGERLEQVAVEISQSSQDYYYSRKGYTTRKEQSCVTDNNGNGKSLTLKAKGYPTDETQSCVTDRSEVEALRSEVEQLRVQLLEVSEKCGDVKNQHHQLEIEVGKLADKVRGKEKGYKDNGFSQGMKDIIALAESRGL